MLLQPPLRPLDALCPDLAALANPASLQPFFPGNARFAELPVLSADTADSLPSGALVRLRGMCTDMFDPGACASWG
jgi:hypothetical protein